MTSPSDVGDGAEFHPLFNDETADIIISSKSGTLYRMHKLTLQKSSRLLGPLFDCRHIHLDSSGTTANPQTDSPFLNEKKRDISNPDITLPFSDHPIERVLSMISGLPIDPWKSFTELEQTVDVVQYLDTPGPLSIIRASCLVPLCLNQPVRLYGLATKFGWDDEAQYAAQQTFSLNLLGDVQGNGPSLGGELSKLSGTALLKLLKLHQRRRDRFRESLYSPTLFGEGNLREWVCMGCGRHRDNIAGRDFRSRLLSEMDYTVDGESILNTDTELESWEETGRCFEARCACGRLFYSKVDMLRKIKSCVRLLPKSL